MEFADRLAIGALVVTVFGLGITILWPTKRWLGWLCMAAGLGVLIWWGWLEYKGRRKAKSETTFVEEKPSPHEGVQRPSESPLQASNLDVFISEQARLHLQRLKIKGPFSPSMVGTALMEALKQQAANNAEPPGIRAPDVSSVVSVILRNNNLVAIRNAHVAIYSNIPIEGKGPGAKSFDQQSISYDIAKINPYALIGEEYFLSVSVDTAQDRLAGFAVVITADNLTRYASVGVLRFVKPK